MVQTLQDPIRRVIAINGSAGAKVLISASCFARYVEIQECPPNGGTYNGANFAPQGLNYNRPNDNYVATYGLNPADIITLGDRQAPRDRAVGTVALPFPDGSTVAATPYVQAISATVTATQVEVREFW